MKLLIPKPIEKPTQLFQSFWTSAIEASCPYTVHREQAGHFSDLCEVLAKVVASAEGVNRLAKAAAGNPTRTVSRRSQPGVLDRDLATARGVLARMEQLRQPAATPA